MNNFEQLRLRISDLLKKNNNAKIVNYLHSLQGYVKTEENYYNTIPVSIRTANTLPNIILKISKRVDQLENKNINHIMENNYENLKILLNEDNVIDYAFFTEANPSSLDIKNNVEIELRQENKNLNDQITKLKNTTGVNKVLDIENLKKDLESKSDKLKLENENLQEINLKFAGRITIFGINLGKCNDEKTRLLEELKTLNDKIAKLNKSKDKILSELENKITAQGLREVNTITENKLECEKNSRVTTVQLELKDIEYKELLAKYDYETNLNAREKLEHSELQLKITNLIKENMEAYNKTQDLLNSLNASETLYNTLYTSNKEIELYANNIYTDVIELDIKINSLTIENYTLTNKVNLLKATNTGLELDKTNSEQKKAELDATHDNADIQNAYLHKYAEDMYNENNELNVKNSTLDIENAALDIKNQDLSSKNIQLNTTNEQLSIKNKELALLSQNKSLVTNANCENIIKENVQNIEKINALRLETETENTLLKQNIENLEKINMETKDKISEKIKLMEDMLINCNVKKTNYEKKNIELEQRLITLQDIVDKRDEAITNARDNAIKYNLELRELTKKIDIYKEEKLALEKEIADLKQNLKELNDLNLDIKEELQKKITAQSLRDSNTISVNTLETTNELKIANNKLNLKELEYTALLNNFNKALAQKDIYEKEIQDLTEQNETSINELKVQQAESTSIKSRYNLENQRNAFLLEEQIKTDQKLKEVMELEALEEKTRLDLIEAQQAEKTRLDLIEAQQAEKTRLDLIEAQRQQDEKTRLDLIEAQRQQAEKTRLDLIEAQRQQDEKTRLDLIEAQRQQDEKTRLDLIEAQRQQDEKTRLDLIEKTRLDLIEKTRLDLIKAQQAEKTRLDLIEKTRLDLIEKNRLDLIEAQQREDEKIKLDLDEKNRLADEAQREIDDRANSIDKAKKITILEIPIVEKINNFKTRAKRLYDNSKKIINMPVPNVNLNKDNILVYKKKQVIDVQVPKVLIRALNAEIKIYTGTLQKLNELYADRFILELKNLSKNIITSVVEIDKFISNTNEEIRKIGGGMVEESSMCSIQ